MGATAKPLPCFRHDLGEAQTATWADLEWGDGGRLSHRQAGGRLVASAGIEPWDSGSRGCGIRKGKGRIQPLVKKDTRAGGGATSAASAASQRGLCYHIAACNGFGGGPGPSGPRGRAAKRAFGFPPRPSCAPKPGLASSRARCRTEERTTAPHFNRSIGRLSFGFGWHGCRRQSRSRNGNEAIGTTLRAGPPPQRPQTGTP
jgi:hypothetical protein